MRKLRIMAVSARRSIAWTLSLALVASATRANAAPAGDAAVERCTAEQFVVLRTSAELDPALMTEVRTDLAAELEQRGLSVCSPGTSDRPPSVVVDVRSAGDALVIELDDRVTHKRVARDLSLQGIPENGRALAVAIAIDELLRASWAELTLQRPAGDESGQQYAGTSRVQETLPVSARGAWSPAPHRYDVGVTLGYVHTAENFDALQLSARGALRPGELGWLELRLSGAFSIAASTPRGDVIARGFGASLTAGMCSSPRERRLFGCGGGRGSVDFLSFRGVRPEQADARQRGSSVVAVSAVALLAYELSSRLHVFGELAVGAVVQGARATDGSGTLVGVTGLLLAPSLGLGVEL